LCFSWRQMSEWTYVLFFHVFLPWNYCHLFQTLKQAVPVLILIFLLFLLVTRIYLFNSTTIISIFQASVPSTELSSQHAPPCCTEKWSKTQKITSQNQEDLILSRCQFFQTWSINSMLSQS
jgi:hypothetical protein